jgi:hypothetical protein
MRFIEIPALITEDIEDPSIVDITEEISVSISGTTMTIDGGSKVSGEATVTLTGDTTVNAFTLQNIKHPSLHKISIKTGRKGNFTYVPTDTVTASSVSTTTKTGSDFEILLITTTGGETYVDFDMADYTSPALYTSNALTGFNVSELTSTYGATAKLYKPDGTLLTTVTSATTGNGVNFGYTESTPQDVTYTLEVEDDLGRTSRYDLPRKWISYAMETNSTPGFEKLALAGNEYTSTTIVPNLTSTSKVRVHKTGNHGYLGINFKIQGRNTTNGAWVDIDDTGENENADESKEFLAFGDYLYHRVWVKPTAKATTTVSSSNVVTLTLSNLTEENVTTSFTGVDPFDLNESTNTYVFEETTKVGTIPFTVTLGSETYTNAVTATTEEVSTVPNTDMTAAGPNMKHTIVSSWATLNTTVQVSGDGKYIIYEDRTTAGKIQVMKGDPENGYTNYTTITHTQGIDSLVSAISYDGKYILFASWNSSSSVYEMYLNDESTGTYSKLSTTYSKLGNHRCYAPAFIPRSGNYDFVLTGSDNNATCYVRLYKHNTGTDTWTAKSLITDPTNKPTGDENRGYKSKSFTSDGKYLMFGNAGVYGGYEMYTIDWDANTAVFSGANYSNNGNVGASGAVSFDGKYVLIFHTDSNSRKIFKNNDAGDWSSATDVTSDFTFEDTDNDQGHGFSFCGDNSEFFVSGMNAGAIRMYRWYPKKEVTLTFSNPTLTLTGQNFTISSAKLYRDDVLFHTYGTESNVVLRSDQTGTYQAIVNDVYYSNRVTPDFTTTRSVSAPQLVFDGYNRLNLSNSTPTSTTLGLPDGTTRDLTTQSNVYIYETGTYTANVQTSDTFAYLSNVVTSQPSQNSADVGPTFTFDGYNRLAISNLAQTSSTLKYGSITYDTNTASNVYVTDAGEYKLEARDANTFVISNVYVGAVSQHLSDVVPTLTFDGYNKLTIDNVDTVETATIKKDGVAFATTTSNTVYIRDTGTYTAEVKGLGAYAIELSNVVTGSVIPNVVFPSSSNQALVSTDGSVKWPSANDNIDGQTALDASGTTLAIGTIDGNGAIYVFEKTNGVWTQVQKMTANSPASSTFFGGAISISGDIIVTCTYGPNNSDGFVYVFEKTNGVWPSTETVKMDPQYERLTGIDIYGTTIVATERHETNRGRFYIFEKTNGLWPSNYTSRIDTGTGYFTWCSAMYGDNLAIMHVRAGTTYSYVLFYERDVSGQWNYLETKGTSEGQQTGSAGGSFGRVMSMYDTTVAITGLYDDSNKGNVYVYKKSNGTWVFDEKISNHGITNERFGMSLKLISETKLLIGSYGHAYIYEDIGGTWTETFKFEGADNTDFGKYSTLSSDGNTAFISDTSYNSNQGAVYVYEKGPAGPNITYDGKNKITLNQLNYEDTATVTVPNESTYNLGTAKTMYVKDTGEYVFKISGTDKYAESNVYVSSVDLAGAPTKPIDFDGYNKLTLIDAGSNVSANVTYFSNTYELGSANVLYINGAGTYDLEMSGSNVFALSSNVVSGTVNSQRNATYKDFTYTETRIKSTWDNYDTTHSPPKDFTFKTGSDFNNSTLIGLGYTEGFNVSRWWIVSSDTHDFATHGTGTSVSHYNWGSDGTVAVNQGTEYAWFTRTIPSTVVDVSGTYKVNLGAQLTFDNYNKLTLENFTTVNDKQWPPTDGTRSSPTWSDSDKVADWTITGASYGNGSYKGTSSVAVWSDSSNHAGPYWAFNNDDSTADDECWHPQSIVVAILTIEMPSSMVLGSYELYYRNYTDYTCGPKDWTVEGSNDGSTWTVLDTRTNQPQVTAALAKIGTYTVSNSTSYSKYRLNVTENHGGDQTIIGEWKLFEKNTRTATLTDPNGNTYSLGQTQNDIYIEDTGEYILEVTNSDQSAVVKTNVGTVTEEVEVSPQLWWNTYTNSSTVDDSSPNNLDGTLNSVTDTDGAFTFDGSSSYIQMATTGATDSNVQLAMWDISCEFYKTGSGATGDYIDRQAVVLVTKGINAGDGQGYDINYGLVIDSNNKLCTGFEEAGSNQITIESTTTINNNQWYTARATFDGTTLNLYLDDTLEATATPTISPASSDLGPFMVGAGRYDTSRTPAAYFQGRIKNVKVYNDIFISVPQPPSLTFDGYNKLSIENLTPTSTRLTYGSNTYEIGTASNVYIEHGGTYKFATGDANTFALVNTVVSGSVGSRTTLSETSIVKQFIYDENGYTDAMFSEASETQCIRLSSDGLAMALGDGNYNSNDGRLYYYERSSISDTFTKTHTFDAVSSGLEFGASVDMNAAKTRIAISGSDADNSAANAGRVYIYDRVSTSASWPSSPTATITPPASTIKRFGHTVNMSDDGLTMITSGDGISSTANESGVYVYEYAVTAPSASTISFTSGSFTNNSSYYEKGPTTATTVLYARRTPNGLAEGYGLLLEYQSDGTTKAYCNSPSTENLSPDQLSIDGGPFSDSVILISGKVLEGQYYSGSTAFKFTVDSTHLFSQGPEWSKTFQVTRGISRFGFKVAMNKTGTRFIAGGPGTAYYVYHKESGTWNSTAVLTGETGYHCGMSPDGDTVAVGMVQYSSNLGRVAVYKYSGSSWGSATNIDTTVGSGIYQIGNTPVFNNDGTLLVTGCSAYNSYMGCFEMWKYENGSWVFKNQFLNPTVKTGHGGGDTGEFFGGYLSMDYAGTSLIVSNTGNDVAGDDYGRVVLYGAGSPPSLTYDTSNKLSIENLTPTSTTLTDPNGSSFDIGTASNVYIRDSGKYSIASKDANTFVLASNTVTETPTGTTYVYDSNTFTTPSQTYDNTKTITVSNVPSHLSNVVGKIYKGSTAYTIHATTSSSNVIIKNTGSYVSVFTTATQAFLTNAIGVTTQPTTTSDDTTIEDEGFIPGSTAVPDETTTDAPSVTLDATDTTVTDPTLDLDFTATLPRTLKRYNGVTNSSIGARFNRHETNKKRIEKSISIPSSFSAELTANNASSPTTLTVTVANSKFVINGDETPTLGFIRGETYTFDQSDASNSGHPLVLATSEDGATQYTTGWTTTPSSPDYVPGVSGAQGTFIVPYDVPDTIYYKCNVHSNMGGEINTTFGNVFSLGDFTVAANTHVSGEYTLATNYDGTTSNLYVNGDLITQTTPSPAISAGVKDFILGKEFDGYVKNFKFWNYAKGF